MKTKPFFTAVLCLFLLSLTSYAQQMQGPPNFSQMRSPAMLEMMKNGMKAGLRTFWDGRGGNLMALGLMNDPDIRTALEVSDEQYREIQGIPQRIGPEMQKHPEFQKIRDEMQALGGPMALFGGNVDEETRQKLQDIQGKMAALSIGIMSDAIGDAITPEQKKRMNESLLANMSEMPMLSPSMFEALDLSDAQKQQMEGIKKELEPAFEKNLEEFTDGSMLIMNKAFDEMEKQGDFTNPAEMQKKMIDITKKLEAEDPEFKKIQQDLQDKGKAFASQFHTKMFDVLNDEQWKRLQNLIDNPPEYAKAFGKKMKEQKAVNEKSNSGWQPGPNSWKPGDAIPEEYRQERNEKRRFPKTEE